MYPKPFLLKLIHKFYQCLGYFPTLKKTAQNKKTPIRRKFAQSGHPAVNLTGIDEKTFLIISPLGLSSPNRWLRQACMYVCM
jgi:hypothetical protein